MKLEAIYIVTFIGYLILTAIIVYRLFKMNDYSSVNATLILISIILLTITKVFYVIKIISFIITLLLVIVNYNKMTKEVI